MKIYYIIKQYSQRWRENLAWGKKDTEYVRGDEECDDEAKLVVALSMLIFSEQDRDL